VAEAAETAETAEVKNPSQVPDHVIKDYQASIDAAAQKHSARRG
jgi:hypothetical protein